MTAIVNNAFRIVNANNLKTDIQNQADNGIYVFIGKSDVWGDTIDSTDDDAIAPVDTYNDATRCYQDMIAAKRIGSTDISNTVPRHNWTSGNSYVGWDDTDEDIYTKEFYVYNNFKVYKCIVAGSGASTVSPEYEGTSPFQEADGYVWKFMYSIQAADSLKFLTNFYMPVKTVVDDGNLSTGDQAQYDLQVDSAGLAGKIYKIKVTDGGSGYSNNPTVTIVGDGSGATAQATVVGGVITAITINTSEVDDNGTILYAPVGTGYNIAHVVITDSSGSGASAYPVLGPRTGHGTNPVEELGGFYTSINVRLEYDDGSGDFIVENSFRQVGIIRNPFSNGTDNVITADTFSALKTLKLASITADFVPGDYITGTTSGAKAYVDAYDGTTSPKTIKFHQNEKTGYTSFVAGEAVTGHDTGAGYVASSSHIVQPEYQPYTGDIIFIENRSPINRSASQIEDLKIVIEF